MRQQSGRDPDYAEKTVRDIRRATCRWLWYYKFIDRPVHKSRKRPCFWLHNRTLWFAKIGAVEGIRMTVCMDKDFREFEQKGFPAEGRRNAISRKYRKGH